MKRSIVFFIILMTYSTVSAAGKQKKAVFIIADGIPADVIERVETPAIDEISSRGGYASAYMGGEAGGITQTPTVSAVCYNTLLTSTWVNKHNVWDNDIKTPNYNYWNIFRIAKNQSREVSTAIFSAWLDNRTKLIGEGLPQAGGIYFDEILDGLELDSLRFPAEAHSMNIFKVDEAVSEGAAACILEKGPDLTWVYLWFMDCVGHEFGDGEEFDKYTVLTDRQIGRIWEAVKEREKATGEEWMVVVTTDHGRSAKDGRGHGGQSERERTIWISTNQPVNAYFNQAQPAIVDIVPSICRYLDFSIPQALGYEQEGVPFIGKTDISDLKAAENNGQIELKWKSYNNKKLDIYVSETNHFKDGGTDSWKHIGSVPAGKNSFTYNISESEGSFYKFSVRGKNNNLPVWIVTE